ncbi:MAG: UDP-N-acetylmuramate dehydrogenase [Prevotella sp.]|jgi:UDP-N-acetylmuramate dehydrogenase|nr:UDP-N-acetylmuramate dehydrogenase [Prevotella sp.]
MKDIRNYNLLRHNTFGIDVNCDRFVEFESQEEVSKFFEPSAMSLRGEDDRKQPVLLLGGGSDLLLTGDYHGVVLHSAIMGRNVYSHGDDVFISVGSGENWDEIVDYCTSNGWHGLENLSYIPGEVGASAIQNIGAYGAEAKDYIHNVQAIELSTGRQVNFSNSDCGYSYRQSKFKNEWRDKFFVTYVTYKLSRRFTPNLDYGNIRAALQERGIEIPTAKQLRETIISIRRNKLPEPSVEGNAGSFFMNPIVSREKYQQLAEAYPNMPHYFIDAEHEKIPAGWMIEKCGWKGKTLGRAGVYEKQALILVNKGGATGEEIVTLCRTIQHDVKEKFGIDIYPEVNIK